MTQWTALESAEYTLEGSVSNCRWNVVVYTSRPGAGWHWRIEFVLSCGRVVVNDRESNFNESEKAKEEAIKVLEKLIASFQS